MYKFNKIIYISIVPLSKKIIKDFYIDDLINLGIEIEYWDVGTIFNDSHMACYIDEYSNIFKTKGEFRERLISFNDFNNTLFIINLTYCYKYLFLFRTLKKYKCSTAIFARGMIPSNIVNYSAIDIFYKFFNPFRLIKNTCTFYSIFLKKINLTKKNDYIFQAGTEGAKVIGIAYNEDFKSAKRVIQINYFDFDNYLEQKTDIKTSNTIVFLDEYLPYHPDFDLLKIEKINAHQYYNELNNFFNKIEAHTSSRVVIAAHPKADYNINPFNNRPIYFGKTLELVNKSKLVLTHASTSISFAVCATKKIILLDSNLFEINNSHLKNILNSFAAYLNLKVLNMSYENVDYKYDVQIDKFLYKQYLYSYLTSEISEGEKTSEIFINFLKKI